MTDQRTPPTDDERAERQDEPGADEAGRTPSLDTLQAGERAHADEAAAPALGEDVDVAVGPGEPTDPVASSDPAAMVDTGDALGGTAGDSSGGAG